MAFYLIQASYSGNAIGSLVEKPQDRAASVRPVIRRMGGKLHGFWFSLGEYDVVAIVELPDNVSAAAMSMAIGSSGALSAYRTTALLTSSEAREAMKMAGGIGYKAPK